MRARFSLPIALAALLLAPGVAAAAGPTLYVCTPTAQILTVDVTSKATAVLFTGSGTFSDCVLGPDGWIYVANGTNIIRVNQAGTASPTPVASSLGSEARGLAFNVTTLYITTASSGVYKLVGQAPVVDGEALDFPTGPGVAIPPLTSGRGVAFDSRGNMALATGSTLQRSLPPYNAASTSTLIPGISPFGVAVNTCKALSDPQLGPARSGTEIVFADPASQSIRRRSGTTGTTSEPIAGLTFSGKDTPLYIEIDSNNDMYIVTGEDLAGSNAKIWKADFPFVTAAGGCSSATKEVLVELKTKLSGPDKVAGLLSASAMGIAVSATDAALTNQMSFSASHCSDDYDFGYHRVTLEFGDGQNCESIFHGDASLKIQVEALKSTLSQTTFLASAFANLPQPIEGMRYSPMGGFIVQYRIRVSDGTNPAGAPVRLIYHFDTQEFIAAPGVGKTASNDLTDTFDENVGSVPNTVFDYWEAGKLDPPAGERGDTCCSKHVVFNAGAVGAAQCTFGFDQPFRSGNPLFNSGSQTIAISGSATNGRVNCGGGLLRVSLFKYVFPSNVIGSCSKDVIEKATDATFLTATSNIQEDNIMDEQQNKYKYNLQTKDLTSGVYLLTLAGPLQTAPTTTGSLKIATACFQFSR
jgi:hypothetical protein